MCLLWASVGNFPIREVCSFLFQELVVSCSHYCLSSVLQVLFCFVLFWHSTTTELSFVFCSPWVPTTLYQYSDFSETKSNLLGSPLKSRNTGYIFFSSLPLMKEDASWAFLLYMSYVNLGEELK